MSSDKMTEAVTKLLEILKPLSSEERQRVMQASLMLLGEKGVRTKIDDLTTEGSEEIGELHVRARLWIKQNELSLEQLQHVFDFADNEITVIAHEVGGKNTAEKTVKAYVLVGAAQLLSSGDPSFEDKSARALCETLGIYDPTNHNRYLKQRQNYFTGSKDSGWKLTAPGLRYAASVIRELTEKN